MLILLEKAFRCLNYLLKLPISIITNLQSWISFYLI